MTLWIDALIVLLVLTNLRLLGSSRLMACVRIVAVQGIVLGLLPLLAGADGPDLRMLLVAAASISLKGVVFPWLLLRALRDASVRREVEPFVGYTLSMLAGVGLLVGALWMGSRLPLPGPVSSSLIVPVALFTMLVGLFVIVSRKQAINQVLGYLALENGIYAFGMAFAQKEPLLIELGILLDVFMAVFVMGITIFHISREFDHTDTDQLSALRD